jgi:hypothetical protein
MTPLCCNFAGQEGCVKQMQHNVPSYRWRKPPHLPKNVHLRLPNSAGVLDGMRVVRGEGGKGHSSHVVELGNAVQAGPGLQNTSLQRLFSLHSIKISLSIENHGWKGQTDGNGTFTWRPNTLAPVCWMRSVFVCQGGLTLANDLACVQGQVCNSHPCGQT